MKILPNNRDKLIDAAMGRRPFDLVIKNIKMLNCFTGEIYRAEIGIYDGFIAHVNADPDNVYNYCDEMEAKETYNGKDMYLIPGFIDTHIHIESTMMTPRNFAKAVVPYGTTTVLTDPHEIANVKGKEAVRYMVENSKDIPMRQYILAPSCVPALPGLENSGAEFNKDDIEEILSYERVIGIAEVMDFGGVINNSERMIEIIKAGENKGGFIQGHAPTLNGRMLSAYLCGGPVSCHESRTGQEAKDKLRAGMYVDARESSISSDLSEIIPAVNNMKCIPNLTLCTDDREPEDIINEGHINKVAERAIEEGLDPVEAVRCVTYKAAKEIGIDNLGAIAPGFVADLVLVKSLTKLKPKAVFYEGKLVAEDRKLLVHIPKKEYDIEKQNTIFLNKPSEEIFRIKAPIEEGEVKIRVLSYIDKYGIGTEFVEEKVMVREGYIDISDNKDLKYIAVLNRHKGHDTYSTAVVKNFGLRKGTIGVTVAHDCHNLTILYSNPREAVIAANKIINMGGGMVCVEKNKVLEKLPLPICGLMSLLPCEELAEQILKMKKALRRFGLVGKNPLLRMSTIALPVIPEARITDLGLVDVFKQEIVPLFK